MDRAVKVDLGMQGIGSTDPAKQRQARKQGLGDGDLSGFLGDLDVQHRLVALMGTEGEQMRRMVLGCPSATHRLAIKRERIIRRSLQVARIQSASAHAICSASKRGSSLR
jgi:hypothetical protein